MYRNVALMVAVLCVVGGSALAQRVDIFTALEQGSVQAEFRGNGDSSVIATLHRLPGGPTEVVIPAGAVFRVARAGGRGWRQYGGFGGPGGFFGGAGGPAGRGYRQLGGRQGMFGYRTTTARLAFTDTTTLILPTLCMDYAKPAPTRRDLMVILPPTDERLIRLAAVLDAEQPSHPAAQLAVWAVADNAPPLARKRYLLDIIPGAGEALAEQREEIVATAKEILVKAGFEPAAFRLFR